MRGRGDMDDLIVRLTKGQVDRLGDRLRKGDIGDDDLRLLDNYRRSFSEAYEIVVGQIRDQLGLEPTGRQEKTTPSIKAKLRRQSIRLSQMQDIAGCRSEERRVGKECRSRWSAYQLRKREEEKREVRDKKKDRRI